MFESNPVLVNVMRGGVVESRHRGRIVIMSSSGERIWAVGDVNELTYPRSAIKAFQSLPMVASGAADHFGFTDEELALTCASHNGEVEHTQTVDRMLQKMSLAEPDLECGKHWPMAPQATIDLAWAHEKPSACHNNCSGKHAGMLALGRHLGCELQGYVSTDHPVQQEIRRCIELCCSTTLQGMPVAPDGCTAPTWAMALDRLALGFARFADPEQLPESYRVAAARLYQACTKHPFYVAGTQRYCSDVMAELKGRVFLKVGAEGVYIAAVPELKLGVALKIDSGSMEMAEVAISQVLSSLGLPISSERLAPEIRNRNQLVTGEIRPVLDNYKGIQSLYQQAQ
ncbi:asparaginase [Nitrincola alkalilacustris]|uniref:asparaginase n=1 Tax=Nitrincola alkalilacustris TaxID=1571224 RepID=UPI00124F0867|nr:asparaginase [Nitrincola alkalilacustris]